MQFRRIGHAGSGLIAADFGAILAATRPFRVVPAQIMSSPAAGGVRPASLLAPLKNATYRRLWTATLLSNFGVWIQSVAAAWLMTSIAPTVDFVAWVQAATALPPLCFTVLGGVLADRFDQRLVFLVAQVIVLSVAVLLSALDHFGLITPWLLLGLTFALDSGSSLRYPAYQTTIGELLPREQLPNALVLASIGWNIARALGPGIGGLIIALAGVPAAFAVNALCNVYIIGVLLPLVLEEPAGQAQAGAGPAVRAHRRLRPCPCHGDDPGGDAALLRLHRLSPARSGRCCRWSPSAWPAAPPPMACCWARWASARSWAPG